MTSHTAATLRECQEGLTRTARSMPVGSSRWLCVVALLLCGVTVTPAVADTIYLTNGRTIRTDSVRIEAGRVIFRQLGGEVSIPLDAVVKIVTDNETEEAGRPAYPATEAPPAATADRPPAAATTPAHPSNDAAYWIERITDVDGRIARVQSELDALPFYDEVDQRLLRFSGQARYFIAKREKWDAMMQRLQLTRKQLLHGARTAGITPGALRAGLGK